MKSITKNLTMIAAALPCLAYGGAIDVKLSETESLHFIECPAGSCDLGYSRMTPAFKKHKVTISRKFWMTECPITVGQYKAINRKWDENAGRDKEFSSKVIAKIAEKIGAGPKAAVAGVKPAEIEKFSCAVCDKIDADFPEGYIVRLPTDAEWEYAFRCGGKLKEPTYSILARGRKLKPAQFEKIGVSNDVNYQRKDFADCGVEQKETHSFNSFATCAPRYAVKTRKPNDWGFYDMAGLCFEYLADTMDALPEGVHPWDAKGEAIMDKSYETIVKDGISDPLLMSASDDARHLLVAIYPQTWEKPMEWTKQRTFQVGFRLVIAPDLASERKAKAKAKPPVAEKR